MPQALWQHHFSVDLQTSGEALLLGLDSSGRIYVDELRPEELSVRHVLTADGQRLAQADEAAGEALPALPPDLIAPQAARAARSLQMGGARWRGLREADRIAEMVQPLSIAEKMALAQHLRLQIPPPAILGLAESHVLSETCLNSDGTELLVCRRLRIAIALAQPRSDDEGEPYDYDTVALYLAHPVDPSQPDIPELHSLFGPLWGVTLVQPLDCLQHAGRLVLVEGGTGAAPGRVHSWMRA